MMSEAEGQTSVLDLELIAQEAIKKRSMTKIAESFENQQDEPPTELIEDSPVVADAVTAAIPEEAQEAPRIPENSQDAPKIKSTRTMTSKFASGRRTLEKNLRQQSKKHDQDIVKLMEQALQDHFAQVDKERTDCLAVMQELKETISSQTAQFASSCHDAASDAAQSEVERMITWFRDEFMKELERKSHEYEDLRATSEKRTKQMSEESDSKSQKILVLDEKIKELASYLPHDVRRELSAELGVDLGGTDSVEKAPKHKTGLFQRLVASFKGQPKPKPSRPNRIPKKTSGNKKISEAVAEA